jgi:hypothetical protein
VVAVVLIAPGETEGQRQTVEAEVPMEERDLL